jgi:hypothetical protein
MGGINSCEKEKNKKLEINQRRFNNFKINHIRDGKVEIKSMWHNRAKKGKSQPKKSSK